MGPGSYPALDSRQNQRFLKPRPQSLRLSLPLCKLNGEIAPAPRLQLSHAHRMPYPLLPPPPPPSHSSLQITIIVFPMRLVTVLLPKSICARKLAEKLEPKPLKEREFHEADEGALPGAPRRPIECVIAAQKFKLCDKLKMLPGVLVRDICGLVLKGPLEVFIVITPL